jgi:hypothetical protein
VTKVRSVFWAATFIGISQKTKIVKIGSACRCISNELKIFGATSTRWIPTCRMQRYRTSQCRIQTKRHSAKTPQCRCYKMQNRHNVDIIKCRTDKVSLFDQIGLCGTIGTVRRRHVEIRHCGIRHVCIRHVGFWHRHVEPNFFQQWLVCMHVQSFMKSTYLKTAVKK